MLTFDSEVKPPGMLVVLTMDFLMKPVAMIYGGK